MHTNTIDNALDQYFEGTFTMPEWERLVTADAYARTAPFLDLLMYLRHAESQLAQFAYSDDLVIVIREMYALAHTMAATNGGCAKFKAKVWDLIPRYKALTANWFHQIPERSTPLTLDAVRALVTDGQ